MATHPQAHSISSHRSISSTIENITLWFGKRWIILFASFMGLYVGLPFLAPVFMSIGWTGAGRVIYLIYSTQCHQLPERSYFFFGPKAMYSLSEIQQAWKYTLDPLVLRQFIGNAQMGWKVAWSDRMVSMYTSTLIFGLLYWPFRRKVKPLPWWGLVLLLLPMAVDGTSHFISDFAGIGQGFRDSNVWLAGLTHGVFSTSFYSGDALGSFNSWMRILTGVFFGLGIVWYGFPYVDEWFREVIQQLQSR
jgi:uncharacterized membrane protein